MARSALSSAPRTWAATIGLQFPFAVLLSSALLHAVAEGTALRMRSRRRDAMQSSTGHFNLTANAKSANAYSKFILYDMLAPTILRPVRPCDCISDTDSGSGRRRAWWACVASELGPRMQPKALLQDAG